MTLARERCAAHRRPQAAVIALAVAIALAQVALIVVVAITARHLPESTRSGAVVLLALLIWAEALWALFLTASRAARRVTEPEDKIGDGGNERIGVERRRPCRGRRP
jgi:protein-S-isoprenylcysteine O-methyltransferase Ste14